MIQEDKLLLFTDLTARLRYGVIVHYEYKWDADISGDGNIRSIYIDDCLESDFAGIVIGIVETGLGYIKPYLRPMRSITEEEIKELSEIDMKRIIFSARHLTWHLDGEIIDYLNKKMLDWRGLIPRGLAIEAPEGMYK